MIKEEKILTARMGKENHFQVPAGYFDQLTEQVMKQMPEHEARIIPMQEHNLWQKLPLRKIAASVAVICMLGGGAMAILNKQQAHPSQQAGMTAQKQLSTEDATFDEMANYTMMDNEAIYASLIAEN